MHRIDNMEPANPKLEKLLEFTQNLVFIFIEWINMEAVPVKIVSLF